MGLGFLKCVCFMFACFKGFVGVFFLVLTGFVGIPVFCFMVLGGVCLNECIL